MTTSWSSVFRTLAWSLFWLAAIDVAAGIVFRIPTSPTIPPSSLQSYFDYGRSVEAKLRTMVTPDDATSAPIVHAGWLASVRALKTATERSAPDKVLVAAYGQSFTHHAMEEAMRHDPSIEMRLAAGPAAPLSYCYKAAEIDRRAHRADVVLMGVLASSLQYLPTMTPMGWGFEGPTPFTYPRYRMERGQLRETPPPIEDLAGLRHVLADDAAYARFRSAIAADASFNPFVFDADVLDLSVIGRLVRRGVGHVHQADYTARYHDARGFKNTDGLVDVARAMAVEFAKHAREDGRVPLLLLIEDRGYEGHLEALFDPVLKRDRIPFLSTRSVAPASNATNFQADGHFTEAANARLGDALAKAIRAATSVPRP